MSRNGDVPTGWVRADLAAIGNLHCGQSPPSSKVNANQRGVPYVTGPEQWDGVQLSVDKWTTSPRRMVPDRCVFITVKGAGVGTIFPGTSCAIGRDVYAFEPHSSIPERFIEHALRYSTTEILRNARGDIPGLSKSHILDFEFLLPPAREQKRIANRIDELFSDLDAGVTALERAKANLTRYRASVLKAAVEGRLTAKWRKKAPDVEPASRLLERILAERRKKWEEAQLAKFAAAKKTPPKNWKEKYVEPEAPVTRDLSKLPEGWCWATIDQLAPVVRGASPRPAGDPKYFGGPIPWITVGSLTADEGPYLRSVDESLTEAGMKASRYIEPDTLLLTNSGATLGVPKITLIGGCINDGSVALLDLSYPTKLYVYYFLKTQTKRLRMINQGAAQPNLNTGIVKSIVVPLAPQVEQKAITEKLEEVLSMHIEVGVQLDLAAKRGGRLRQGVLNRAFLGKLVPQDPNDEPASRLLERIKAEREVAQPKTHRARSRKRTAKDTV